MTLADFAPEPNGADPVNPGRSAASVLRKGPPLSARPLTR